VEAANMHKEKTALYKSAVVLITVYIVPGFFTGKEF
jgi:hypothetical protein